MREFLIHIGCICKIFKAVGSLDAAIPGKPRRIWPVYLNNITGRAFCLHPDIHAYVHDQGMCTTYEPRNYSRHQITVWRVQFTRPVNEWHLSGGYSGGKPWEVPSEPALDKIHLADATCPPGCTDATNSAVVGQSPTGPKTRTAN
jgi:hypothetical protein